MVILLEVWQVIKDHAFPLYYVRHFTLREVYSTFFSLTFANRIVGLCIRVFPSLFIIMSMYSLTKLEKSFGLMDLKI